MSIKWVRSYINLNLKFHDYSCFFTAFHVASYTSMKTLKIYYNDTRGSITAEI